MAADTRSSKGQEPARARVARPADSGVCDRRARESLLRDRIRELSLAIGDEGTPRCGPGAVPRVSWLRVGAFRGIEPVSRRRLRALLPGWLASAVAHTVVICCLGLVAPDAGTAQPRIVLVASPALQRDAVVNQAPVVIHAPAVKLTDLVPHENRDPGPIRLGSPTVLAAPLAPVGFAASRDRMDEPGAAFGRDGRGLADDGRGHGGAEFYGVQAAGNRFVFIVDSSISMTGKVADVVRELESAVRRLREDQEFYAIFFDHNTERLRLGTWHRNRTFFQLNVLPEKDLVPASEENIDAFTRWLNTIQLEFNTDPSEAVAYTLNRLKPDAIFLLTDGEFTDGGKTEAILREDNVAVEKNGRRRPMSAVHCIGFYSREGEITLKRLAAAHGGTYRFVEPPPGYVPRFTLRQR